MTEGPLYGPEAPKRLPPQDANTVLLHAERFNRAAEAQRPWAEVAKRCVEYFEGKQWSAGDLAKMAAEKRPALTFNKIRPLVNLVHGYMLSNPTECNYLPGNDSISSAQGAEALNHISKSIGHMSDVPYVDSEVWLDGILTGRGYFDGRLSFCDNDFGELQWRAQDPFQAFPDPDGDQYDINSGGFFITSRWLCIDEVEYTYGKAAAALTRPLISLDGYTPQATVIGGPDELITPWRTFGGEEDRVAAYGNFWADITGNWVDRTRKTIRLIDIQHYVWVERWMFVDLETGDRQIIPPSMTRAKVEKISAYAASQGNPLAILRRPVRALRWTHMVGDIIVYDEWSPYETFTVLPFFPYFRRGQTRGMVHDLLDPQDEVNKRRSARLNIVARTANGGWMWEKGTLDAENQDRIRRFGSTPGVEIVYDTMQGKRNKPEQIQPASSPIAHAQLEQEAEDDLKEISGVNDSALGLVDKVQSGRAVEARQRQTVVGLEGFNANWRHTKRLFGKKQLAVIQSHYTEQRIVRVRGDSDNPTTMIVNQRTAAGVINNVTLGKYDVAVDETPLSKSFLQGQFEEVLRLKELQVPIPDEWLVEYSSLGRKDEIKAGIQAQRALLEATALSGSLPPPPHGGGKGPDGGNLPANEPGAPSMAAE